jgi:hypothetical protein
MATTAPTARAWSRWRGSADVTRDGYGEPRLRRQDGSLIIYDNGSLVSPWRPGLPEPDMALCREGSWQNAHQLAVGDVTGDGYADVVFIDDDGVLNVYQRDERQPGRHAVHERHVAARTSTATATRTSSRSAPAGSCSATRTARSSTPPGCRSRPRAGGSRAATGWAFASSPPATGTTTGYGDLVAVDADGVAHRLTATASSSTPAGCPIAAPTWHIDGDWRTVRMAA